MSDCSRGIRLAAIKKGKKKEKILGEENGIAGKEINLARAIIARNEKLGIEKNFHRLDDR